MCTGLHRLVVPGMALALAAWGAGCGGSEDQSPAESEAASASSNGASTTAWMIVAESDLTSEQQARFEQAAAARDALFGRLVSMLLAELQNGGPAAAVEVCSQNAPELATNVSEEMGVTIGRTSWKLRNPANQPPEWAVDLIAERPERTRVLTGPDETLATLMPIRMMNTCLMCHGPVDQISSGVRTALGEHYPEDEATGFEEGDLRGWFWVEVPASAPDEASG